jgi:hypothetical protein
VAVFFVDDISKCNEVFKNSSNVVGELTKKLPNISEW